MEALKPIFTLNLFGYSFGVTINIIIQWAIIVIVGLLSFILTRNLKVIPDKKQNILEIFVETVNKLVRENMGESYLGFVPFIGTLMLYLLFMNLTGFIGVAPPTSDYSINLGMAAITFVVVQAFAIRKIGIGHYFGGYFKPYAFIFPLNIIERIMLPVSLSLRLFGNMTAAVVIMDLVYSALAGISWIAQLVIPVPLHMYFDLFDGTIQMVIFVMLTMINIKITAEH
ncbi:F0F1 ATP synthase subunit A [Clostridium rectalis]|uniref:F0F1 ATP synthase subunit A n=1 Tax=Clostridium rectalis TaxID=2040295 RepID=UPI000F63EBF8|nr:F0F1 ATP synthase subunit A [Clostridium rectalis]